MHGPTKKNTSSSRRKVVGLVPVMPVRCILVSGTSEWCHWCGGSNGGRLSFPCSCLNHEAALLVVAPARTEPVSQLPLSRYTTTCSLPTFPSDSRFFISCSCALFLPPIAPSLFDREALPSEPSLHRIAQHRAVTLLRMLDFAVVLHQTQQCARVQVDILASFDLAFLALDIDLDLQRQVGRRKAVARRSHRPGPQGFTR